MPLALNEEQRMLRDTARDFLQRRMGAPKGFCHFQSMTAVRNHACI